MKKKKIFRIFHTMIIFMSFINLIHGKINNIERFLGITTIPNSETESETIFPDWSSIPTNIKTSTPEVSDSTKDTKSDSSFNDDKSDITNPNTSNRETIPTYFQTTEIESTFKSDIPTDISTDIKTSITSETLFTTNSNIPESTTPKSTENPIFSSSFFDTKEPTTTFSQEPSIPTPNPSSEKEYTIPDTNTDTDYTFTTYSEDTIPTYEIPTTDLNVSNSVNIPTIPTTSTNQISNETIPTIPKYPTTIIVTTNKPTETIYKDTSLILLGFSHYNKFDSYFSFYIYFSLLKGSIYSNDLKFPVQITYNTNLRLLQNNEAICTLKDKTNQKILYLCQVQTETQNIDNIKIIPEFNFILHTPSVDISPFANNYINNIQNVQNKLNINSNIYILKNPKINKGKNRTFNISSIINEPSPKFQKVDLVLTINMENENKTTDINCNVIDINNNNYIIQCKVNENKNYTLQNGISVIEDEILLINFDDYNDSRISFVEEVEGLGAGPVLAIIIILIFFGYFI